MSTIRFFIYSSPSPPPSAPAANIIPTTPPPQPGPKALLGDFDAVSSSPCSPTTPTTPTPIPSPNPTPPRLRRLMKLAFKVGNQELRRQRKLESTLQLKRKQKLHNLLSMSHHDEMLKGENRLVRTLMSLLSNKDWHLSDLFY